MTTTAATTCDTLTRSTGGAPVSISPHRERRARSATPTTRQIPLRARWAAARRSRRREGLARPGLRLPRHRAAGLHGTLSQPRVLRARRSSPSRHRSGAPVLLQILQEPCPRSSTQRRAAARRADPARGGDGRKASGAPPGDPRTNRGIAVVADPPSRPVRRAGAGRQPTGLGQGVSAGDLNHQVPSVEFPLEDPGTIPGPAISPGFRLARVARNPAPLIARPSLGLPGRGRHRRGTWG